ncbi:ATP-binding protein [Prosthecobacter sp.]|uniref:ATP-binding protein n=1 Tax=Prosthecobacter sp. TaxID=1965333 RepID=UPI003784F368
MTAEKYTLPPDPARMVEGLRDTGYVFKTAVADVIDNSIAAEASEIDVELKMAFRGSISLRIFDNGTGMDREGLINAMRYGAKVRPSLASLGKFGLGLKTASTAFCRKLSVISRANADDELIKATWSLDHVAKEGWELLLSDPTEEEAKAFNAKIGKRAGTLVIWDQVDRLLRNFAQPDGAHARKALTKYEDELREHLALIYQRYLDGKDTRARTVILRLNDKAVSAWDPFCEEHALLAKEETFPCQMPNGTESSIRLRAFILPRKEEFKTDEAFKAAKLSNFNQGIYIYRENRLIHGPDWLKLFSKEPHYTLLRVEFSFDHKLDEAFHIDIKKSQIILDEALYEHLTDFLNPVRREAERIYRSGQRSQTSRKAAGAHDTSNRNIGGKEESIKGPAVLDSDEAKGEATIQNPRGKVKLKIGVAAPKNPNEIHIQPVDSLEDGLLWQPAISKGPDGSTHIAAKINTGHPYYQKVYVPNLSTGVTIQGMDALLWGLSVSELNCTTDADKRLFDDLRFDVSRNLRKLVEDLPEPEVE